MASTMLPTLKPLLLTRPATTVKLLISRANFREKSINTNASIHSRLTLFTDNRSYSIYSSLQICSGFPFSYPSLCFVFQSCSPYLRSPVFSMTTTPQANSDNPSQSPSAKTVKGLKVLDVQLRAVIKGRVQGVFYRNWTIENATQLGLKGWVRNRRDGSVEALFSGDSDKVQEMEQRCRRGPLDAMVTGLQVFPCDDDPGTGFQRKRTV